MLLTNKIKNFHNRYIQLGSPQIFIFYLNNLFFGEQVKFNTCKFIQFLKREKRMKKFFNNDDTFWNKINVDIEYLYENCRRKKIKFVRHDQENGKLTFKYKKLYYTTDYSLASIKQIISRKENIIN